MSEWKTVRLGDVFDLQMGKTPERKNLDFFSTTDNKWISIADISKADKYIFETKEYISDEAVKKSGIKQIPANTVIMSFKLSIGKTAITKEPMYSNEAIMAFLPNGKYEVDNVFLYHLFSNKDWSEGSNKAVKGITLNKASLLEAKILLPSLTIQKQIAKTMDKCTEIISKNKRMLEKYDTLIKSQFIEMFGNPQCISNNWKVNPLSDYCIVNPKKSELGPIPDDYELSFIPMQSVSENGDVDTSSIKHYKDVKTGFTYFRENDVLFAKITPCMENGKGGVARKLKNQIGFGSTEFHVLRPIETISNSEWIYRLTTFKTFRKDAENNMTGSAGQRRTPKEFFDKYKVGLPPIELQNDFAAFVQQIDKSKFAVQKSLEKAETLYKSLMQEYFA